MTSHDISSPVSLEIVSAIDDTKTICVTHWRHDPMEFHLFFVNIRHLLRVRFVTPYILVITDMFDNFQSTLSPQAVQILSKSAQIWVTHNVTLRSLDSVKNFRNKIFYVPLPLSLSLSLPSPSLSSHERVSLRENVCLALSLLNENVVV